MEEYFRKVDGIRPGNIGFPEPIVTFQYDAPIGPIRPTFRERLGSEVPVLKSVADRFVTFAQNHPINRESRERMERNTPHERMETPYQERREHHRKPPFTIGSSRGFEISDFLPQGMGMGVGPTFDEMSYGTGTKKRSRKRKQGGY